MRIVLLGLFSLLLGAGLHGVSAPAAAAPARAPVLVELFTSQGCSSCPPADTLLPQLGGLAAEAGLAIDVIPLSFHVDYWDDLGWRDPFASPRSTARQEGYARVLGRGLYTPQLVVGGRAHAVGSQRGEVLELLRQAAAGRTGGALAVALARRGETIEVTAALDGVPDGAEVWVALAADATTEVARGENAGQRLAHAAVVRQLVRATVRGKVARARVEARGPLERPAVVAFAQDPRSRAILAVGRAPLL